MSKLDELGNVLYEGGKSIVTDRNVVNATQQLLKTTIQGGATIGVASGTALLGSGGAAGIATAASSAGAAISSSAAGVGTAIMGTPLVSTATTLLASPLAPIVAGVAVIGFICWLCSDD